MADWTEHKRWGDVTSGTIVEYAGVRYNVDNQQERVELVPFPTGVDSQSFAATDPVDHETYQRIR